MANVKSIRIPRTKHTNPDFVRAALTREYRKAVDLPSGGIFSLWEDIRGFDISNSREIYCRYSRERDEWQFVPEVKVNNFTLCLTNQIREEIVTETWVFGPQSLFCTTSTVIREYRGNSPFLILVGIFSLLHDTGYPHLKSGDCICCFYDRSSSGIGTWTQVSGRSIKEKVLRLDDDALDEIKVLTGEEFRT